MNSDIFDNISEALEHVEKYGTAECKISVQDISTNPHASIEKLRLRGTPVELIHSYFLAEQPDEAQAAFRTSLLEYLYERLAQHKNTAFQNRDALTGAPLIMITTKHSLQITDSANTAIMRLLEELTSHTEHYILTQIDEKITKVSIIPDECIINLDWFENTDRFETRAVLSVCFEQEIPS